MSERVPRGPHEPRHGVGREATPGGVSPCGGVLGTFVRIIAAVAIKRD